MITLTLAYLFLNPLSFLAGIWWGRRAALREIRHERATHVHDCASLAECDCKMTWADLGVREVRS